MVAKRIIKDNKLSTNYGSELFDILARKGAEAEIRSKESGKIYRRNVGHLKRFVQGEQVEGDEAVEAEANKVGETVEVIGKQVESSAAIDEETTARRSRREVKIPQYLKHYVTHVDENDCSDY